jgi:hypothetical protein
LRIALLGGTGSFGSGLALRWARHHEVVIGSRSEEKAERVSRELNTIAREAYGSDMAGAITGRGNVAALEGAEVVLLTIPYESLQQYIELLKPHISDQVVISTIAPIAKVGGWFIYTPKCKEGRPRSAAEDLAEGLETRRVVAGFHTIPAHRLRDLKTGIECDVPLVGDDPEALETVAQLVREIPGLRPVHMGSLQAATLIEGLGAALINVGKTLKVRDPMLKVVW